MEINISSGNFTSKNSNVIYEYIGKGNSSLVKSISISDGTFVSESKDVFNLSDSFKNIHSGFISGGDYSSDPSSYLKSGYSSTLYDGMYNVSSSAMKQVGFFNSSDSDNDGVLEVIGILLSILVIVGLLYFNKKKLFII